MPLNLSNTPIMAIGAFCHNAKTGPATMASAHRATLIGLTGTLVSSYVKKNAVPAASLPKLIETVHDALNVLADPPREPQPVQAPAVPIKKSVFPDYLVCLEDGKRFRTLRRHLQSVYGLTPDAYREKWGLKPDYPMVAPGYATQRAALARSIGLGRRRPAEIASGTGEAERKDRASLAR